MRFTPASILLATAFALSASSGFTQKADEGASNPRAAEWVAKGKAAQAAGKLEQARDAYETGLVLAPRDTSIYMELAKIARAEKVPGKAIRYYGRVLEIEPTNQLALQGEGLAMMEKGATESARETLAKLRTICKTSCASADPLVASIAVGAPKVASAQPKPEAGKPATVAQ